MKKLPYEVPEARKRRVIIDTDANAEADDQYAIVHALLTPQFQIKGLVAAHYGAKTDNNSMERSYKEILKLLDLMDMKTVVPVFKGGHSALVNEKTPQISEGAEFMVTEALRADPRRLFVVCQGAITNLASACLMNTTIAKKLTAIWIGGPEYPEGGLEEFNMNNDINAANVIFDSEIDLWQVPMNVYSLMKVSFAELWEKVRPYGKIGKYLFDNMMRVNRKAAEMFPENTAFAPGECWQLGDSPVIGLMLTAHHFHYDIIPAPRVTMGCRYIQRMDNTRKIRAYNYVDSRFILEDMFAKLKYNFGK
jgi:purine nucleosidase